MTVSSLDFDYHALCIEFIRKAIARPRMWYNSLSELEQLTIGHEMAFVQLGMIDNNCAFRKNFTEWLFKTKRMSCSAGWAYAIEQFAGGEQAATDHTFAIFFEEFVREWKS